MTAAVLVLAGACACVVFAGCASGLSRTAPSTTNAAPQTQTYRVPSSGMEPTIHCAKPLSGCLGTVDDQIVVQAGKRLERKAIVVFRTTRKAAAKCRSAGVFVKRLIGLPGETVHEERNGFIDIDGKRLAEPYVGRARRRADTFFLGKTWHVPAGHYFVIGDNRPQSCDSRVFGSIPAGNVIGPVTKIIREGRKKHARSAS